MSYNSARQSARLAARQANIWRSLNPVLAKAGRLYGAFYAAKARRVVSETLADLGEASAILAAHDAAEGLL